MDGGVTRRRVRVGLVIAHLGPGGAQRVVSIVANALAADGWDVHVVTLLDEPADTSALDASVRRHRLGCRLARADDRDGPDRPRLACLTRRVRRAAGNLAFFAGAATKLRRQLRDIEPDTVLSLVTLTNLITILATRGLAVRTVVSERNDLKLDRHHRDVERLRRWIYRWADVVTANTYGAVRDLRQFVPASKLSYVPNPVNVPVSPATSAYRGPTFVCIGRLTHQKGLDTLLKAAKQAFDALPGWRMAILGTGPLRGELESLADTLGISERLDWVGYVPDPFPYLRSAEFFVSTSRFEGSPNALVEAMSCGLPVIVTDASPGPLELVGSDEAGLVVSVDDVDATTAAIRRLAEDQPLRQSLGRAAAARARAHRAEHAMRAWRALLLPTGQAPTPTVS